MNRYVSSDLRLVGGGGDVCIGTGSSNSKLTLSSGSSANAVSIRNTTGGNGNVGILFSTQDHSGGREKAAIYHQETHGSAHYGGDFIFCLNTATGSAGQVGPSDAKMRISRHGYTETPGQRAFSAHTTSGQTNLTSGDKIAFNSTGSGFGSFSSRGGGFDTSNHKYVVPVTGLYLITVALFLYDDNNGNICSIVPRVNNSQLSNGNDTIFFFAQKGLSGESTLSGSLLLQLTAGDDLTVHARNGNSGTHKYYGAHSHFQGYLVG